MTNLGEGWRPPCRRPSDHGPMIHLPRLVRPWTCDTLRRETCVPPVQATVREPVGFEDDVGSLRRLNLPVESINHGVDGSHKPNKHYFCRSCILPFVAKFHPGTDFRHPFHPNLPVSTARCVIRHAPHLGRDEHHLCSGRCEKSPAQPLGFGVTGGRQHEKYVLGCGVNICNPGYFIAERRALTPFRDVSRRNNAVEHS